MRAHFALVAKESTLPVVVDSCIQVAGSAGVSLGGAVVGGDWNVNDIDMGMKEEVKPNFRISPR
jgi:hypothetical protein